MRHIFQTSYYCLYSYLLIFIYCEVLACSLRIKTYNLARIQFSDNWLNIFLISSQFRDSNCPCHFCQGLSGFRPQGDGISMTEAIFLFPQINLSTSPTPAQIISRSQTSNTTSSSITQQTMLLGSTSPTLSASQAQMYLRAQMVSFDCSPCKVWLWSLSVGRSKLSFLSVVDIGLLFCCIFFLFTNL